MAQAESPTIVRIPQPGRARVAEGLPQAADNRGAPRVQASSVPSITGVRLKPFGVDATLLNISASGALVECTSRLRLGTAVTVVFDGAFSPASVEGRVARSSVATVSKNGVLRYHVGIAFQTRIPLDVVVEAETTIDSRSSAADAAASTHDAAPEPRPAVSLVPPLPVNRW